jgi:SnoaL-like domain
MTVPDAETLDKLWSVHEIRQLAYRFAQAHDSRDMDEMDRIFLEAASPLTFPEFNLANVRATLPEYWRIAGPTMLFVANHIIELTDRDHAAGSVYCLAQPRRSPPVDRSSRSSALAAAEVVKRKRVTGG